MKFKDVAKHYLGCKFKLLNEFGELRLTGGILDDANADAIFFKWDEIKPLLRPLSDMNAQEAKELALMWMRDGNSHLDEESQIDEDEIQYELHKDDGGNMLDADVEICIELVCGCFEAFFLIKKDGSITIEDEVGKIQPVAMIAQKVAYLLSKHFDLFGLIEANEAIDITTLNPQAK
jgi:hypothetical protein